ncbi:MAG: LolA-related protein [Hydrogenovibrio sp.]|uniref:LolA-related protein n=1 Tax=Hydrogenovibrio sp. TaxID=2065821 RepID=UPI00286FC791|nr:LolA-related protein [Hydrogenovibrio sp.]MDR9499676.1 LolA-related protein [Hydrogenovibrio sp.]
MRGLGRFATLAAAGLLLGSLWLNPAFSAGPNTLAGLLAHWPEPAEITPFEERRYDQMLELTTRYQGQLHYHGANWVAMHYHAPMEGFWQLKDGQFELEFPGQSLSVSLAQMPEIAAMIRPMQFLLSGELDAIRQDFEVEYTEQTNATRWQLLLTAKTLLTTGPRRITIHGHWPEEAPPRVTTVRIDMTSGDWRKLVLNP